MVFNATFNNTSASILWRSVFLVEETRGPGEKHQPVASHWQIYHIMLYNSPCSRFELTTSVKKMCAWISQTCIQRSLLGQRKIVQLFRLGLVYGVQLHFQQYFSYIVAVSFIGGGNRRTQKKPPTCRKSLTNLSHNIVHLTLIEIRTRNISGDWHWLHR